ncbi:chitobiase/beta-hexosaminidase C-terminal domain-containing protein [Cerasicoccus fimbriatus]|uniref:chitobiase/beta-hexosaminidase C-terminal domain-containing protein n=1 Tax=Cerasicoccus fimbriatus TaxID=3014554 RepID=UPI0022B4F506|nr:chitobiase/beta-hexosaminidase C-terminal domain-containing protein [Cerasicoccus sp. TK19100]
MKRFLTILALTIAATGVSIAQTANDEDYGIRTTNVLGAHTLSWWGKSGYIFFLQGSSTLDDWFYDQTIYTGEGAVIDEFNFTLEADPNPGPGITNGRIFWRLRPVQFVGNAYAYDFDGDYVDSYEELIGGTDPLSMSKNDDSDVFPDDWEIIRYGTLDSLPPDADFDGDTILDIDEFTNSTDPTVKAKLLAPTFPITGEDQVDPFELEITNPNSIGVIRYTLDGSEPTQTSTAYNPEEKPVLPTGINRVVAKVFDSRQESSDPTNINIYRVREQGTPPQTVYYGIKTITLGGLTITGPFYSHSNSGFHSGTVMNLGMGWVVQHGNYGSLDVGDDFLADTASASSACYYVRKSSGMPPQLQGFVLHGYTTDLTNFSPDEYISVGYGWIKAVVPASPPGSLAVPIEYEIDTSAASTTIYFGTKNFAGGSDQFYSTNPNDFASNTRLRLGKGWTDGFNEFTRDLESPSEPVYYGFLSAGVSTQIPYYSHDSSSFIASRRVYAGDGWITNPEDMESTKPGHYTNNLVFGRKNSFTLSYYVVADGNIDTLDGPTVSLGAGYLTSSISFNPDATEPAADVWFGAKYFWGSIGYANIYTYNQPDIDSSPPQYQGEGWVFANGANFGAQSLNFLSEAVGNSDDDEDGLNYATERFVTNTDPNSWDSDGDLISDSVELELEGFDPNIYDDPYADIDGDGLDNYTEFLIGARPDLEDSDGDGFTDAQEYRFGTSASDSNDNPNSEDYNPNEVVELRLTIGDHSGSHSERWSLKIVRDSDGKTILNYQAPTFGEVAANKAFWMFRTGEIYTVTVEHVESNISPEDFDYTADIQIPSTEKNAVLLIADNQTEQGIGAGQQPTFKLLGEHNESETNYAVGKSVKAYLPVVEIVKSESGAVGIGDLVVTDKLKVAKLEDSLNQQGVLNPNLDPDRFYVRVPGLKTATSVSVFVETENQQGFEAYNDDPTEIELVQSPDQEFWLSPSMVLVSDIIDDGYYATGMPTDETKGDRTHLIALGGDVIISKVIVDDLEAETEVKADVDAKHSITVNVVGLTSQLNMTNLLEDLQVAKERYAQVGISVNFNVTTADITTAPGVDASNGIDILEGIAIVGANLDKKNILSNEFLALVDAFGTPEDNTDIHVFVVDQLNDLFEGTNPKGFASVLRFAADIPADEYGGTEVRQLGYAGNVIVSNGSKTFFTIAHEIGHILTNHTHYGNDYAQGEFADHNLMKNGTAIANQFTATKRLYELQQTMIDEFLGNQ